MPNIKFILTLATNLRLNNFVTRFKSTNPFIMTSTISLEDNINMLQKYVEYFPDFPKPGIHSK